MPVLSPSEYNAAYFRGVDEPGGGHPAGYDRYGELWERRDLNWPGGTLGEYHLDIAAQWINEKNLGNKEILELGCGTGLIFKSALDLGIHTDSRCVDVSQWAYDNAGPEVQARMIVGDARDNMRQAPFSFKKNQFDVAISTQFLECFDPAEIQALIDRIRDVSKAQFHVITEDPNPSYYTAQTLNWWATNFSWGSGCIVRSFESGQELTGAV